MFEKKIKNPISNTVVLAHAVIKRSGGYIDSVYRYIPYYKVYTRCGTTAYFKNNYNGIRLCLKRKPTIL